MGDNTMPTTSPKLAPKLTEVRCAEAPPAGGHYAQAMLHGTALYVSGQLGVTRDTPDAAAVSVTEQVAFALGNIERIARVVGAGRDDVARCTVFVTGIEHWDEANRAYAAFFGAHRPARSVVPCAELHFGAKVEIEAIVAVGG
jgi:2-iminobutanoate/2-iminopropanoate deaminase